MQQTQSREGFEIDETAKEELPRREDERLKLSAACAASGRSWDGQGTSKDGVVWVTRCLDFFTPHWRYRPLARVPTSGEGCMCLPVAAHTRDERFVEVNKTVAIIV